MRGTKGRVVILMGSERDLEFCKEIGKYLQMLKVDYEFRVCSAHKTPEKVLETLRQYEDEWVVYVTVAGRSNALSAFVDANTTRPVIACPPYCEKYGGADIFSSLRVPSGVASLVTIEPESAALAAAKILAVENPELEKTIKEYRDAKKREIEQADAAVKKLK
ncbi:AIR carboxylase family protein [Candidatus Bathyarchaeota archaeon]|nr:AIR carboxylase family protein [Candidatus Bathyarchaeota archaeon]